MTIFFLEAVISLGIFAGIAMVNDSPPPPEVVNPSPPHRSSVKDFELHNQSVIHTIYALHKWGWIRKRIPCTFFNPVDFIVFATEIIATLRFLS